MADAAAVTGSASPVAPSPPIAAPARRSRAGYIDWMRGLAVLIMILAHAIDSWTVLGPTRQTRAYFWFMVLAGMGAPLFLWLAGLAVPLAAHARMRRGATRAQASWSLQKRGWEIFGLALLFRLQAYVFSAGATAYGMLKVDILNVMGISLVAAGWCWGRASTRAGRIAIASIATIGVLLLAGPLRVWTWPDRLPEFIEWYLRPPANRSTFTLFPWSAFVFSGLAIGEWLASTPEERRGVRLHVMFAVIGTAVAVVAYALSFQPTWLPGSRFWTTSPMFFAIRFGAIVATLGLLFLLLRPTGVWARFTLPRRWSPMELLGQTSLFIYWVHVELVYGVFTRWLHKRLSFEMAIVAFVVFTGLMLGLAMLKSKYWDRHAPWTA